ncbi:MAG: hypothetical protein LUD15_05955 [Bacteroides sp.]|nr:hypothetical protein [Bacteroides sp.]
MKSLLIQCLEFIRWFLPFLRKKDVRRLREFSDLIVSQYQFLTDQLEHFQRDYYELSGHIREMHKKVMQLNEKLREALAWQCRMKECKERKVAP